MLPHMPDKATILRWVASDAPYLKGFHDQYARAMDHRVEQMADELLDIADDGRNDWEERETARGEKYQVVNQEAALRSKIRIETRKWLMGKLKPKKYGDSVTLKGDEENPLLPPAIIVPMKEIPGASAGPRNHLDAKPKAG